LGALFFEQGAKFENNYTTPVLPILFFITNILFFYYLSTRILEFFDFLVTPHGF